VLESVKEEEVIIGQGIWS